MTIHSTFHKGAKVWVILKTGEKFVDYWEGKSNCIIFRNKGKILIKDIKSTSIFKNKEPEKNG